MAETTNDDVKEMSFEAALSELNGVIGTADVATVREKSEALAKKMQEVGSSLYAQEAPAGESAAADDDTVVDAEIVDEDESK